jgi:hypothetical protein
MRTPMLRTFAATLMLAMFACCAACSSSSSGGGDASSIDVLAPELDAALADAGEDATLVDAGR